MEREDLNGDKLLAGAISYLIDGQELYEASLLLLCDLEVVKSNYIYGYEATLSTNRTVYEIVQNREHPATIAIMGSLEAVLPTHGGIELVSRVRFVGFEENWRKTLLEAIQGKVPLNQCLPIQDKPRYPWENLLFRSAYEIAIAKALNEYNVLFLPNCMGRFGSPSPQKRMNKEADFLVCYEGKWGIIEVDGETFHANAAKDHDRDRLFRSHGVRVIERFTGSQCISNPTSVVEQFLRLLKQNG
jgi:hypothetical protein